MHMRIADDIRIGIETGKYPPGTQLPTLEELAADIGVVHLPCISDGVFLEDQHDVSNWASAFEQLKARVLSPGMSARLIRDIREMYAADQLVG
jgi:hypothetical protein